MITVCWLVEPDVAVTVIRYVPGVVPAAIAFEHTVVLCRTQPVKPLAVTPISTIMTRIILNRRRFGTKKNNENANAEPLAGRNGKSRWDRLLVVQLGP